MKVENGLRGLAQRVHPQVAVPEVAQFVADDPPQGVVARAGDFRRDD